MTNVPQFLVKDHTCFIMHCLYRQQIVHCSQFLSKLLSNITFKITFFSFFIVVFFACEKFLYEIILKTVGKSVVNSFTEFIYTSIAVRESESTGKGDNTSRHIQYVHNQFPVVVRACSNGKMKLNVVTKSIKYNRGLIVLIA